MENWKRAVIGGSAALSAILFLKGKGAAGVLAGGVGLAVLASEYPDTFEQLRDDLPRYVERGSRFLEVVSRAGARLATLGESRGRELWDELTSYR
jgi:hypothetical protein